MHSPVVLSEDTRLLVDHRVRATAAVQGRRVSVEVDSAGGIGKPGSAAQSRSPVRLYSEGTCDWAEAAAYQYSGQTEAAGIRIGSVGPSDPDIDSAARNCYYSAPTFQHSAADSR